MGNKFSNRSGSVQPACAVRVLECKSSWLLVPRDEIYQDYLVVATPTESQSESLGSGSSQEGDSLESIQCTADCTGSVAEEGPAESVLHVPEEGPAESVLHVPEEGPAESVLHVPEEGPAESVLHVPEEGPTESVLHVSEEGPAESVLHVPEEGPAESVLQVPEDKLSLSVSTSSEHALLPTAPAAVGDPTSSELTVDCERTLKELESTPCEDAQPVGMETPAENIECVPGEPVLVPTPPELMRVDGGSGNEPTADTSELLNKLGSASMQEESILHVPEDEPPVPALTTTEHALLPGAPQIPVEDCLTSVQLEAVVSELRVNGPSCAAQYIQEHIGPEIQGLLLHTACQVSVDLETFNTVLMATDKDNINFVSKEQHWRTPLHVACSCLPTVEDADSAVLQRAKVANLLEHQADCRLRDKDGNTPLHLATLRGDAECVQLILSHSRSCRDVGNNLGNTALHIACQNNYVDIIKVLLEHKADARTSNRTKKQRSPLHLAVSKQREEAVEALLDYEPSAVDCTDKRHMRPLHLACKRCYVGIVKNLLKRKHCPVFIVDKTGRTPLHYACMWRSKELVKLLLKQDKSRDFVNHQDLNGDTALHIAGRHGNRTVMHLLISSHASTKVSNEYGETPKEVAMATGIGHGIPIKRRKLRHIGSQPSLTPADSVTSLASTASTVSSRTDSTILVHTSDESDLDETV